jgi:UDP-N-acetylglucosamine--N-acetylmuramyl-(pentapeptide) pyrophosphoryl-undecaprenol N-acetylglucosamine transferase
MKIVFTGGGSGGHIFPIIAIVQELKKIYRGDDLQLYFIGPKGEIPFSYLTEEGIKVKKILAGKFRRYFNPLSFLQNLIDIFFKIPVGIVQSFFYIFFLAPDLIFSKGGYGSLPVVLTGYLLGTPIIIHESDVVPGLVNRFLSKFAMEIFVSFPVEKIKYLPKEKMIFVGNPIRLDILGIDKKDGSNFFSIKSRKPVILILGGSQGSQRINEVVFDILNELLIDFEVIHQVGQNNFKEAEYFVEVIIDKKLRENYHYYSFLDIKELSLALNLADLVISRAGSGSISEIAAVGKPSILVPLPESAQNHQLENAYLYAQRGACIVIEENNLTPHFLLEKLKYLFSHPSRLKEMAEKAQEFAKIRAGEIIAQYIVAYLTP